MRSRENDAMPPLHGAAFFLLDEFVTRFDDEAVDGDGERGNVFFIVQNLAISVLTSF